jgi:hypothetical protein
MADVVCAGVRGVQQIRRSRSASRIVGKTQGKIHSAKTHSNKHGLESQKFLKSLLDYGLQLSSIGVKATKDTSDVRRVKLEAKDTSTISVDMCQDKGNSGTLSVTRRFFGREIQLYEDFYIIAGADEHFDDQHAAILEHQASEPRYYFGKEIHSYEELFNLAGSEGYFDDQHVESTTCNHCETRLYFGKEIRFYEELYNLVGDDTGRFDDEPPVSGSPHRRFYQREIESYEDFFILAGAEEQFDDECI